VKGKQKIRWGENEEIKETKKRKREGKRKETNLKRREEKKR
jgi:hypothetical protein